MPSTLLTSNNYTGNSGDNTSFRAYGTAISNAFANAGWVQTADSGQVNWSTVVANGTASTTIIGTEFWRMNDALQNTCPIFVKFDWWTQYSSNNPSFQLTMGQGTTTTGALTGAVSATFPFRSTVTNVSYPFYFCGDSSRIAMSLWANASGTPVFISIERTKDSAGNDTAEGALVIVAGTQTGSTSAYYQQFYYGNKTGMVASESSYGIFAPANISTGSGNAVQLYPIYFSKGIFVNPGLNQIALPLGHSTPYAPFTISYYGNTHTFCMFPNYVSGWSPRTGTAANYRIAMRWE